MPNSSRSATSRSTDKGGSSSSSTSTVNYPKNARANWFNIAIIVLLPLIIFSNIFGLVRLQSVINYNQAQTAQARKVNAQRQVEMKAYIQCIALLSKKYPDVNFPTLNYDQAKTYLDDCAKSTSESER